MNAIPALPFPVRCDPWFDTPRQRHAFVEDIEHEYPRVPRNQVESAVENACKFIHPAEGRRELYSQIRRFLC